VKRRWRLGLIGACVVALLALTLAYPDRMINPGALVSGHAALEKDCFACHAPGRGATSERCLGCHRIADIGIRTTGGVALVQHRLKASFHTELAERDCLACHREHQGRAPAQRSSIAFSHSLLRADARDRCGTCHLPPRDEIHLDPAARCTACHRPEHWKPATFDHARYFVLDPDHDASCATCHSAGAYRLYTCYGCHAHRPQEIRSVHAEEGISRFDDCVRCHRDPRQEPEGGG